MTLSVAVVQIIIVAAAAIIIKAIEERKPDFQNLVGTSLSKDTPMVKFSLKSDQFFPEP